MIKAKDFGTAVALEGGCLAALRLTAEKAIVRTYRIGRLIEPVCYLWLSHRVVCASRCTVPVGVALDIGLG